MVGNFENYELFATSEETEIKSQACAETHYVNFDLAVGYNTICAGERILRGNHVRTGFVVQQVGGDVGYQDIK